MFKRAMVFASLAAVVFGITPGHAANVVEKPLGSITLGPDSDQVTIHTSEIKTPRWFGVRVFTVPPGRMITHTKLSTKNASYSYTGSTSGMSDTPGLINCISDFGGKGSPTGGIGGTAAGTTDDQADPAISMIGGFAGTNANASTHTYTGTGCSVDGDPFHSKDIVLTFETTGPITFAFYGAFFGSESADWRDDAGNATGNRSWWNLWGNFTDLGYATTQG